MQNEIDTKHSTFDLKLCDSGLHNSSPMICSSWYVLRRYRDSRDKLFIAASYIQRLLLEFRTEYHHALHGMMKFISLSQKTRFQRLCGQWRSASHLHGENLLWNLQSFIYHSFTLHNDLLHFQSVKWLRIRRFGWWNEKILANHAMEID